MGLTYTIDESRNLVIITGEYADAQEWERLLNTFVADERRRPGCVILRDQRGCTKPVNAATVVGIMQVVRRFWPVLGARRAAIISLTSFRRLPLSLRTISNSSAYKPQG